MTLKNQITKYYSGCAKSRAPLTITLALKNQFGLRATKKVAIDILGTQSFLLYTFNRFRKGAEHEFSK
ncbi:MAG: hypothetical protein CO012_00750 [Syntrophobacterales bacterium CG_4_8_14_3_um_filter_49_14]|nr:MAG: hypothetical protein CO012_00750 [Syntrophobacterales bacterium CG_4_8_14_3_um_filter_49_14]